MATETQTMMQKHEPLFENRWQEAAATGRRETEYCGTIIPTLHGTTNCRRAAA